MTLSDSWKQQLISDETTILANNGLAIGDTVTFQLGTDIVSGVVIGVRQLTVVIDCGDYYVNVPFDQLTKF